MSCYALSEAARSGRPFLFSGLLARASFTVMSECYRFGHGGFAACTVAYYGCNGEEYVESYPAVNL